MRAASCGCGAICGSGSAGRRRRSGLSFRSFHRADAMYAPVVTRLRTYGVDLRALGDDGVAHAYMEAVTTLPAMRDWTADAAAQEKLKI